METGYGTEAVTAMIEFGFRELDLVSISGETVSANAPRGASAGKDRLPIHRNASGAGLDGRPWLEVRRLAAEPERVEA